MAAMSTPAGHAMGLEFQPIQEGVGQQARLARPQDFVGQAAQVFDERQRQHARPRPELADGERRHALVGIEERLEAWQVDPAVAVADQLDRHRIDAGPPEVFPRGQRRQVPVVRPRQVPPHIHDLRREQMKIVEQPLGGGGDVPAGAHVRRQGVMSARQDPRIVVEAGKDAARARARIDSEPRGERKRAIVKAIGAQDVVAKGTFVCWWRPAALSPFVKRTATLRCSCHRIAAGAGTGKMCRWLSRLRT